MRLKIAALLTLAAVFWLPQIQAGVNVGSTRVIYQSKDKEANLSSQTPVTTAYRIWCNPGSAHSTNRMSADEFIITPPLFRLDANSQNILRVIATNAQNLPTDKESLFFST